MRSSHPVLVLAALLVFNVPTHADIRFGPVLAGAGQSVRLISHTTTLGGTVKLEKDGGTSNGKIQYSRERDLTWTFRDPGQDGSLRGMVTVTKINTFSTITIDGKTENADASSPLNGKMFAMSKAVKGDWKFELDGSVPLREIDHEISELTLYLKRKWYPHRTVKIGDSWEFDPSWIRMLIERDLKDAQTIGTMTLRQIHHAEKGASAIIDVSVRSTGAAFRPDGTDTAAQIDLRGQVVVNLKTMLDESLVLKGTVNSRVGKAGEAKTVTLPVQIEITKTLVNS